jgi:hypothetical protein
VERLRHLVVIVPGIGGSVLDDGAGKHRWGPRLPGVARGILSPANLSLSEHGRLVPVGLMPTVVLIPPFVLPGYDRLVRQIGNAFAGVRVDVARPGRTGICTRTWCCSRMTSGSGYGTRPSI